MDNIFAEASPDNFNEVRGRTLLSNVQVSRNSLVSSTKFSVAYYKRMEHNNATIEDIDMDDVSLGLSYETTQEKAI